MASPCARSGSTTGLSTISLSGSNGTDGCSNRSSPKWTTSDRVFYRDWFLRTIRSVPGRLPPQEWHETSQTHGKLGSTPKEACNLRTHLASKVQLSDRPLRIQHHFSFHPQAIQNCKTDTPFQTKSPWHENTNTTECTEGPLGENPPEIMWCQERTKWICF